MNTNVQPFGHLSQVCSSCSLSIVFLSTVARAISALKFFFFLQLASTLRLRFATHAKRSDASCGSVSSGIDVPLTGVREVMGSIHWRLRFFSSSHALTYTFHIFGVLESTSPALFDLPGAVKP